MRAADTQPVALVPLYDQMKGEFSLEFLKAENSRRRKVKGKDGAGELKGQ